MVTSNTSLFGCCSDTRNNIIREYQRILVKLMIEEPEFYHSIKDGLDINSSFVNESSLRMIVGTLVDMKAKYDSDVSYDSLEIEVLRKMTNEWDIEEATETFRVLKSMELTENQRAMCKEQFEYWKQFVILAKIANATVDMMREPWFQTDGKINKMIEDVKTLSGQLKKIEVGDNRTRLKGEWF